MKKQLACYMFSVQTDLSPRCCSKRTLNDTRSETAMVRRVRRERSQPERTLCKLLGVAHETVHVEPLRVGVRMRMRPSWIGCAADISAIDKPP